MLRHHVGRGEQYLESKSTQFVLHDVHATPSLARLLLLRPLSLYVSILALTSKKLHVKSRDCNHLKERVVQVHKQAIAAEPRVLAHAHGNGKVQERLDKLFRLDFDAAHCNLILGRRMRRKPDAVWTVGRGNLLQERHAVPAHQPLPFLSALSPHPDKTPS